MYGSLIIRKGPNYKETIRQKEDELVDYFLYEMRKAPAEQPKLPDMPIN